MAVKSYLTFEETPNPGAKTKRWCVNSAHNGAALGWVCWHSPWRKYVFGSHAGIIYDQACLRELADFVEKQTKAHKAAAK